MVAHHARTLSPCSSSHLPAEPNGPLCSASAASGWQRRHVTSMPGIGFKLHLACLELDKRCPRHIHSVLQQRVGRSAVAPSQEHNQHVEAAGNCFSPRCSARATSPAPQLLNYGLLRLKLSLQTYLDWFLPLFPCRDRRASFLVCTGAAIRRAAQVDQADAPAGAGR